ncbi:NACHT domain-containing protein [Streptomyces sp. NPDC013171]|uniref:NACHT domain-containing protein n=1 Tax=Streptomyces sp. NPDC013171 TaxID=3364863 RepID=UPI0036A80475
MERGAEARRRFADWLHEVHVAAGTPSSDKLEASSRAAGRKGRALSSSGVQRLLSGKLVKAPEWEFVTAFLDACVACAPASAPVPAALVARPLWWNRHQQLVTVLATTRSPARSRGGQGDEPSDAHAVKTYARRVRESYGRLDLEVLTPDNDQSVQQKVELREVFVVPTVRADPPPVELSRELMVRLLQGEELAAEDELPPGLDLALLDSLVEAYRQRPPEHVLEVLAREENRRVVLLGDPGAGKSTLAHYLAMTLTADPDPCGPLAPLAGHVPLVVELRHYAQPAWRQTTFEDFLEHLWATEGMALPRPTLSRLLGEGRIILVFDGLDEIFDPEFRAETARRIAGFAARHERCRVVVTSRVVGYQRKTLDGADFTHYMIQDLDTPRIHAFARRWFDTACPEQPALADRLFNRFKDAVAHSASVRELAGNPLLLTILAILGRRQTLPRDRHGVYQHAVTVLVARWDRDAKHLTTHLSGSVADALDALGQVERLEMLRLLARRMQEGAGGISGNYIPEADIEDVFRQYLQLCDIPPDVARRAARAMVQQLRERNFILARYGGGAWGFVHRTFLEYLAAADIVHRYEHEREWTPEALVHEVLLPRARDTTWHEVILLLAGQLRERDTGTLVDGLVDAAASGDLGERLSLALRALAEVKKIGVLAPQSTTVVDGITRVLGLESLRRGEYLTFGPSYLPVEAAAPALASFSEHWTGRGRFLAWFHVWGQFLPGPTAARLACALHRDETAVIAYARFTWSPGGRAAAVAELAARWSGSPVALETVRTCAVHDEDVQVRGTALRALVSATADTERAEELHAFLQDRAVRDPAPGPRKQALDHLLAGYPDDRTRRFFEQRAVHDRFDAVRAHAESLVDRLTWPDGDGGEKHEDARIPLFARQRALARLEGRLEEEGPESEAEWALTAWRSGRYRPLVELGEPFRPASVEKELALWLRNHPDDLRMLMCDVHRLTEDTLRSLSKALNRDVREYRPLSSFRIRSAALAIIGLAPGEDTRDFLVACARELPDDELRVEAAHVLAETQNDDPAVAALLLDLAQHDPVPAVRLSLVRSLARDCSHRPAVRDVLYTCAAGDPDADVRLHALNWMAQWWPDHPGWEALFGTDAPGGGQDERLLRLKALASGGRDEELTRALAAEPEAPVREQLRHVRLLQEAPERTARAVFRHRLLTGFGRLLKARRRAAAP